MSIISLQQDMPPCCVKQHLEHLERLVALDKQYKNMIKQLRFENRLLQEQLAQAKGPQKRN